MNWVSLEKRKPPEGVQVLVAVPTPTLQGGWWYELAEYTPEIYDQDGNDSDACVFRDDEYNEVENVTYWCALMLPGTKPKRQVGWGFAGT